jgi:hypothetical protein
VINYWKYCILVEKLSRNEINVSLEAFFELVIQSLKETGIQYVVVGGIASIVWGRPRTTNDVDVVIKATPSEIVSLANLLEKNGFVYGTKDIAIALKEKSIATILHKDFPYKMDIQGVYEALDERSLANRLSLRIFNLVAYIEKPEDLIIAKLRYGSTMDFEDAKAILIRQNEKLDYEYLENIAKQEDLEEDLHTLIASIKKYFQK